MRFFSVVAALAIASSVAATPDVTCPPLHKIEKCLVSKSHSSKAPRENVKPALKHPALKHPALKHPALKHPVEQPAGKQQGTSSSGKVHKKPRFVAATDKTSSKIPGMHLSPAGHIETGVYALVNVKAAAFLSINMVNGVTSATLTKEPTFVSVTSVQLGDGVTSVVIDAAIGVHLTTLVDVDAQLQLSVGGVVPSESTCSSYFRPMACGVNGLDAQRMVKRSLTGDVVDVVDAAASAALKLAVVTQLVVPGIARVAASVCFVAEASVHAKVLALTSVGKGGLGLDAFADVEAATFLMLAINPDIAKEYGYSFPVLF